MTGKVFVWVCALHLFSAMPVPTPLRALYRRVYRCAVHEHASAPVALSRINEYFPHANRRWPIVTVHADASRVRAWLRRGIHPGLLLAYTQPAHLKFSRLAHLRALVHAGAVPIAPLRAATPSRERAARYLWCMRGLCPAAWYLVDGVGQGLALVPQGLYLSAPHWQGHPGWPLPARAFRLWGRRVLVYYGRGAGSPAGVAAQSGLALSTPAFDPAPVAHWRWWGIRFRQDQAGLETNWGGSMLLRAGRAATWLAAWVEDRSLPLTGMVVIGVTVAALVLGGVYIAIFLIFGIAWLRRFSRGGLG